MKVVAYSIKPFNKEYLARANQKKHDITLISDNLNEDTARYAKGKKAVLVSTSDDVSLQVILILAALGVRYISTRSSNTGHIDTVAAARHGIEVAGVASYSPNAIAEHSVALAMALNRRLIKASANNHHFDFKNDELVGFNFFGKTVGLIGLGNIGSVVARIYHGLGCKLIGFDTEFSKSLINVREVQYQELLELSDIISIHLPLTALTRHLINTKSLDKMKNGVMIINTSRGAILNSNDVFKAVESGKIGYLGLDLYELEQGLSVEDNGLDLNNSFFLKNFVEYPNVLITVHQGYLTREALGEIASQTIKNLDLWESEKYMNEAFV